MWKRILATVMALLSISAFAKVDGKDALTDEQKNNIKKHFGDAFLMEFESHLNVPDEEAQASEHAQKIETLTAELNQAKIDLQAANQNVNATKEEKDKLAGQVENLNKMIVTLSAESEKDPKPVKVGDPNSKWNSENTYFLGGINEPMYAIGNERPYNVRAYNAMARNYGGTMLPYKEASSMDYTTLKSDLGEYYRLRKQDQIQSFLVSLPNIEDIFPLESGYQDQAVLVNMFMGEFSQAENTVGSSFSNLVKGTYTFEPEILQMYGVMFAHNFTDLKEIEKNWLGYLNREHSNVIKMSFIQYILVETAKKLHNEKQNRYINGIYVAPTANVKGAAINAANGLREFIRAKIAGFQILPFDLGEWTSSTINAHIYSGTGMVPQAVRDSGRVVLYMAPDALTQYWKNRETLYGVNQDYKANTMVVPEYPNVTIKTVPGMGASKRLIWTLDNNIKTYTDGLGEMLQFNLEQQDWNLKVWSNWKESIWANLVGKKYASKAAMPTDYSTQMIFTNNVDLPAGTYVDMVADDTTPSVKYHKSLQSVSNTGATAITALDDAVVGDEIRLKCNSITNAITIAASGNFSLLTAAWTPGLGDVLIVKKRSDGKYIELSRSTYTTDALVIADGDATPSVALGTEFITSANTGATAITALDDAALNTVYTLYGGSNTNSSTIANSGNFVLTAAMTLAIGTYIKLEKAQNGKFYEISRG